MEAIGSILIVGYLAYWVGAMAIVGGVRHRQKGWLTLGVTTSLLSLITAIAISVSMLPFQYRMFEVLPTILTCYGLVAPAVMIGFAWRLQRRMRTPIVRGESDV